MRVDELVIDCYRLAKFYSVSPLIFLAMTLSEIRLHFDRTNELQMIMQREQSSDG